VAKGGEEATKKGGSFGNQVTGRWSTRNNGDGRTYKYGRAEEDRQFKKQRRRAPERT